VRFVEELIPSGVSVLDISVNVKGYLQNQSLLCITGGLERKVWSLFSGKTDLLLRNGTLFLGYQDLEFFIIQMLTQGILWLF